jgi:hypothetical protein
VGRAVPSVDPRSPLKRFIDPALFVEVASAFVCGIVVID